MHITSGSPFEFSHRRWGRVEFAPWPGYHLKTSQIFRTSENLPDHPDGSQEFDVIWYFDPAKSCLKTRFLGWFETSKNKRWMVRTGPLIACRMRIIGCKEYFSAADAGERVLGSQRWFFSAGKSRDSSEILRRLSLVQLFFSGGWNYFDLLCLACAYTDIVVTALLQKLVWGD